MAGRKSLFEPVAEKLIAQIREGRIAPGEKMPSEYELCTHYAQQVVDPEGARLS